MRGGLGKEIRGNRLVFYLGPLLGTLFYCVRLRGFFYREERAKNFWGGDPREQGEGTGGRVREGTELMKMLL